MSIMKLIKHTNAYKVYVATTISYGLIRKSVEMKTAKLKCYDHTKKTYIHVPVLTSDKILITAICGFAAMYVWPIYVYRDMNKIELALNKDLNPKWYCVQTNKHVIDYFFS